MEQKSLQIIMVQDAPRLDKALAKASGLPRTRMQCLIAQGAVKELRVSDKDTEQQKEGRPVLHAAKPVRAGQMYHILVNATQEDTKICVQKRPAQKILADVPQILFEDMHIIVVNKQAMCVVHPAPGHCHGDTLTDILLQSGRSLSQLPGVQRPGIVHRLDQGTTGVMVLAKSDPSWKALRAQFSQHSPQRLYHALVRRRMIPDAGHINVCLGKHPRMRQKQAVRSDGKDAMTHYRALYTFPNEVASHVVCRLETGRTHQVRVHLAHKGCPLLGDTLYGRAPATPLRGVLENIWPHTYPALHAAWLRFKHPITKQIMTFQATLPNTWPQCAQDAAEKENSMGNL